MVQVHHDEGVANRIAPESCADGREGIGEALTGERIGQPLSRDSTLILGADVVPVTEGNTDGRDSWRRREGTGDMIIVRYADDFIVGFEHESDARRFLDEMRERLREFALSLHSEKTRLIEFGRFAAANRKRRGLGKPETFTFLGFTFICSKTRRGKFQIKRKSRRDRMRVKLQAIKQELRRRMHQPIPQQGRWLQQVVTGYFNYHAVPTNGPTLTAFLFHVTNLWRRTLRQRSQKDWTTWERIKRLADDWLPKPRNLHPWPERRFAVRHPRWEPYARIGPVWICAGGAR